MLNTTQKSVIIVRNSMVGYGDGWTWQVKINDKFSDEDGKIVTFRTNRNAEGLWKCGSHEGQWAANYDDRQIEGTAQFSLPKEDYARARRIVKRCMEAMYS